MPELVARNAFDAGAIYALATAGPHNCARTSARVLGVTPAEVPGGLIRASLASYARYWREAFRLPSMDKEKLRVRIEPCLLGREHIRAGLGRARRDHAAAAQRELGHGRGVDGRSTSAPSPPSPSGSSRSRCIGGSSTTARAWASRSSR